MPTVQDLFDEKKQCIKIADQTFINPHIENPAIFKDILFKNGHEKESETPRVGQRGNSHNVAVGQWQGNTQNRSTT